MSILVICPGCKAQFNVSEKYAGKQGPCPKCKAVIAIPKGNAAPPTPPPVGKPGAAPPAKTVTPPPVAKAGSPPAAPPPVKPPAAAGPPPEVKIHAPDDVQPGKTRTGAASLKPIVRTDARLTKRLLIGVVGLTVAIFVAAWFGGRFVQSPPPLTDEQAADETLASVRRADMLPIYGLRALGLLLIGWPIVLAGYAVLRDDELEPYRGGDLRRRILICLTVYIAVWGAYLFVPVDLLQEPVVLGALVPMLLLPAAVAAYFCFDLDYLGSAIHAGFFFLVTLLLGATAGLSMPWAVPSETEVVAPLDPNVKPQVIIQ